MNAAVPATAFRAADRISAIGVSDIVRITQAANELKRQGQPVIVLGLGEPDFDTPAHVIEAAQQAMAQGDTHYTVLDGTPALKAAIQLKFRRDNGLAFATNEITVGAGAAGTGAAGSTTSVFPSIRASSFAVVSRTISSPWLMIAMRSHSCSASSR